MPAAILDRPRYDLSLERKQVHVPCYNGSASWPVVTHSRDWLQHRISWDRIQISLLRDTIKHEKNNNKNKMRVF